MALGHDIKGKMQRALEDKILRSRTIILCAAQGLKAREMDELRLKMKEEKFAFFLLKNTLALKAFKKSDLDVTEFLKGDTFYALGEDDPVRVSRALVNFARDHEPLRIKAAVIDKRIVDTAEIKKYASLPAREILLQEVVSGIKAPLNNLVFVLKISLERLVLVLKAIGEKK